MCQKASFESVVFRFKGVLEIENVGGIGSSSSQKMTIKSLLLSFFYMNCCLLPIHSKEINYGSSLTHLLALSILISLLLSFPSSPFQKWNPYSYSFCQPLFFRMGVSLEMKNSLYIYYYYKPFSMRELAIRV